MKINNEAKVGLLVTFSFTLFIAIVALLAKINVAQSGYKVGVYFGFLNNLSIGAPVRIGGGIKIGFVESIKQSGEKTEVTVWIDNKYKLIKASKFAIFTRGMIGEKYINVFVPPSVDVDEFFSDGDKSFGIDPASIDQIMLTFQSFMQDKSGGEILADIFQNSKKFVENLNKITDENRYDIRKSVLSGKAMIVLLSYQMKVFMKSLNKFTGNMAKLSEKNKEEFSIAMKNISEMTRNLNKIIYRLEKGRGTLGKLLTEEDIYRNLNDASIYAKDLFRSLSKDPSKLLYRQRRK
ncbi:MlaD family protein [Spirochaetota bacterium]